MEPLDCNDDYTNIGNKLDFSEEMGKYPHGEISDTKHDNKTLNLVP